MTGSAYFGRSRAGPHFSRVVYLDNGVKEFKSYDEQIDLLSERGMDVGDRDTARTTLQRVNYYRLSGYWYPFRKQSKTGREDDFYPGPVSATSSRSTTSTPGCALRPSPS